jgi:ketosteroid isomerase-like protein
VIVAAAVVALGGCGGSGGPTQQDKIKETLITYYKAFASGDSSTACNLITNDSVALLEKQARGKKCTEVLDAALKRPDYQRVAEKLASGAKVTKITVVDGKATAAVVVPGVAGPGPGGTRSIPVALKKESGTWKIATALH